jgi:hypothetical protein
MALLLPCPARAGIGEKARAVPDVDRGCPDYSRLNGGYASVRKYM